VLVGFPVSDAEVVGDWVVDDAELASCYLLGTVGSKHGLQTVTRGNTANKAKTNAFYQYKLKCL
jgi:hypothetical protein